jgi:Flp pilus assembly protein TadD
VYGQAMTRYVSLLICILLAACASLPNLPAFSFAPTTNTQAKELAHADSLRLKHACVEAIPLYQALIRDQSQTSISALEGKGLCEMELGKMATAVQSLHTVIAHDALRWRALNAMGVMQALAGHPVAANEYYQMALDAGPPARYAILNNQGLTYALANKLPLAIRALTQASQEATAEAKPRVDLNLSLALGLAKRFKEAEQVARPHLSEAALHHNMAQFALLANDTALAKKHLSQALSASSQPYPKASQTLHALED